MGGGVGDGAATITIIVEEEGPQGAIIMETKLSGVEGRIKIIKGNRQVQAGTRRLLGLRASG